MRTTKRINGSTVRLGFDWHGGTYVDVAVGEAFSTRTFEVINVEDAEGNRPSFTRNNFHSIVNNWLAEYGAAELLDDMRAGDII